MKLLSSLYPGCRDVEVGKMYRDLIQTDYFRVVVVDDVEAVEVCGALKVRLDGVWDIRSCC